MQLGPKHSIRKKKHQDKILKERKTFRRASSFNPFSAESMLSMLPSPTISFISRAGLVLFSVSPSSELY